jgi:putative protease
MEGKQIGSVFHYFDRVGVAAIELTSDLKLGDSVRIVGRDKDFVEVIDSMQIDGKNIENATAGDKIGIKVSEKVGKGYKVYKS